MYAVNDDHSPEKFKKIEAHLESVGRRFDALFAAYDIDVIIASGDSGLYNFSAVCG